MGSAACPFIAYVVPADLYAKLLKKQGKNVPIGVWAFKYFGLAMIAAYSSGSLFAWHVRLYIGS
jgi:hypothetical protein